MWRCSSYFAQAQAALGIALAPGQVEGLRAALSRGLTVITGGPGTGKTTVLKCLLAICERRRLWVELAAPMGRAARRMSDATRGQAKTIHRILQFAPGQGGFRKNRSDPLACNLCVVDEASMVDTLLMHRIPQGLLPEEQRSLGEGEFLFIEEEDPVRAVQTVVELVREGIPRRLFFNPVEGIQVLAPMHKGAAGSTSLNQALQTALNPGGAPLAHPDRKAGPSAQTHRIGDKVM